MPRTVNAAGECRPLLARRRIWGLPASVALLLALAGCGYQLDSPRLPNHASRLSIAAVKNETTTGEVDVRLQQQLRSRLLRHSSFDLVPLEGSDMSLEVVLEDLRVTRGRDLTSTNVSSIVYDIRATASLLDRRTKAFYFSRTPVNATYRLDFDAAVIETPAIRDEGLTGVLDSLAARLESLVTRGF